MTAPRHVYDQATDQPHSRPDYTLVWSLIALAVIGAALCLTVLLVSQ